MYPYEFDTGKSDEFYLEKFSKICSFKYRSDVYPWIKKHVLYGPINWDSSTRSGIGDASDFAWDPYPKTTKLLIDRIRIHFYIEGTSLGSLHRVISLVARKYKNYDFIKLITSYDLSLIKKADIEESIEVCSNYVELIPVIPNLIRHCRVPMSPHTVQKLKNIGLEVPADLRKRDRKGLADEFDRVCTILHVMDS